MKVFIVLFLLFCFCGESPNPLGIENPVSVSLYLNMDAHPTKVSCEGQIVSYLQYRGERDTIIVPDGSELKSRTYHDGIFKYDYKIAVDGLHWIFP